VVVVPQLLAVGLVLGAAELRAKPTPYYCKQQ
jgi:hypothetical protein